jgi:hypothetical protein
MTPAGRRNSKRSSMGSVENNFAFPKAVLCPACGELVPGERKHRHRCFFRHLDEMDGKLASLVAADYWGGRKPERHCRKEEIFG